MVVVVFLLIGFVAAFLGSLVWTLFAMAVAIVFQLVHLTEAVTELRNETSRNPDPPDRL